ncbi:LysR family transcriptional regulator [Virgibacillus pantothenticus]|uniref:LysR family transcriptional regulator n=1 Tax=Virgibacillus pantothenticus TaxID=1473 RepID=UPI001C2186EA|nr:LysR family transcriptional regulator [Virgibacillus pantothenticus]MBU8568433.1 LysR family transcriptional regulator [Virgibacillus pantothenticus]MBU8602431.1 LysR family transcriptional regulator [Virgibacillus pantothenticus]MBU8636567.1 LysR family transcriptional regulator [Virgibacillus pantothenticus]MBU8644328.1 LysR family transcriptional regulator [Virgibacillus pantothenticus]MBU8648430.1 LysR family transcriptional regulator [Virgibacillus pantothenticus]
MNIEKIKYFIDLVECRSFTETAKKNYVSQTTISQQIASLEKEFDMQLIDRKQIPIEPTQAGSIFYEEAIVLWKQYNHMQAQMKNYQQCHTQLLSIEYSALTDIQVLLRFITSFKELNPTINLKLNKVLLKDISEFLRKGIYDAAIAVDSEFKEKDDILTHTLYRGRYCAVVGSQHSLFHNRTISKEELYKYPLIMLNSTAIGTSYYLMIQNAIKDGYEPNILQMVDDVETELFYIVTENLIGFLPDNYSLAYPKDEVRLIPLKDSHHTFNIEIGYFKDNPNPSLQRFLRQIQDSFPQ